LASVHLHRLKEGIERFFITDINNPGIAEVAQSLIPMVWDNVSTIPDSFNHVAGGANVMFMDGHVEFLTYPNDRFPVTKEYAWLSHFRAE